MIALIWPGVFSPQMGQVEEDLTAELNKPYFLDSRGEMHNIDPQSPNPKWLDADKGQVKWDGMTIFLSDARLGFVQNPKDRKGPLKRFLQIQLETHNGPIDSVSYKGGDKSHPILRDDKGKPYRLVRILRNGQAESSVRETTIPPGKNLQERFFFEPPQYKVAYYRMEFPATLWGKEGVLRFHIPQEMVKD